MDLNSLLGPLGDAATWSINVTSTGDGGTPIVLITASTAEHESRDLARTVAEQLEADILTAGWRAQGAQLVSFAGCLTPRASPCSGWVTWSSDSSRPIREPAGRTPHLGTLRTT